MSQFDTTAAPKQNHTLRNILIALVVILLVCCIGGVVVFVGGGAALFNAVKPIADSTEGYMQALKAGDYQKAYNLLTPELQTSYGGSADAFKDALTAQGIASPTSWTFSNFSFNQQNNLNEGVATGTAVYGGTTKNITLTFVKSGDTYKVSGFTAS